LKRKEKFMKELLLNEGAQKALRAANVIKNSEVCVVVGDLYIAECQISKERRVVDTSICSGLIRENNKRLLKD